jgi:hypothetical protein
MKVAYMPTTDINDCDYICWSWLMSKAPHSLRSKPGRTSEARSRWREGDKERGGELLGREEL